MATSTKIPTHAKKRGKSALPETKERNVALVRERGLDTSDYANAALIDPDKPLTDKQKGFVKFWAAGESLMSAAYKAGYDESSLTYAYRLAKQPNVLKLYEEEKRLYEEASNMSRKKVMDMLVEAYDMAKLMAEPASMVSAAREIGKMCGYYEPVAKKVDITVNGKALTKRLDAMSDEDLAKMIAEGMGAIAALEADQEDDE